MSLVNYIVHPVGRGANNHLVMVDIERFCFTGEFEKLWLDYDQDGNFRLACLPFRVYGLALRDQVALNANKTTVTRLAQRSGHRLLRLALAETLTPTQRHSQRQEHNGAISANGALAEWSGRWHLAVDVPPESSIGFVERIVAPHLEAEGVHWEWADAEHFN